MRFVLPFFLLTFSVLSLSAADWNQWRGPDHDGVTQETKTLATWPSSGPKLLWQVNNLGAGYSNLSFSDDRFFTMGDRDGDCCLFAFSTADGKELWKLPVGKTGGGGGYQGPRCTPATDGKLVFALGQFGDFVCADAKTGKLLWKGQVEQELGGRVMSGWGFSMSPIIDGNQVVLPIGGDRGTVIALDRSSKGPKILWRSSGITDAAAYNSVVPVTIGGTRQYVLLTDKRIAGLDAKTGEVLWQTDCPGKVAVCSDPAFWMDGPETCYIMASCAYDVGGRGFKVTGKGKRFKVEDSFEINKRLQNHHGGIVQSGGYFYLLTQNELVCVEPKSGEILWRNRSVGKGATLGVGDKLIVRAEGGDGNIALVDASKDGYKEHARFPQPNRSDKNSWTYPVLSGGKLYVRDQGLLLCYEVE